MTSTLDSDGYNPFQPSISERPSSPSKIQIEADIDAINVIGTDPRCFADTISPPNTSWKFSNIINRRNVDTGARFTVTHQNSKNLPSVGGKKNVKNISLNQYPNIELCTVSLDRGIQMHISLYILKPLHTRNMNYLTKEELCVICAAMNFACKKFDYIPCLLELFRNHNNRVDYMYGLEYKHKIDQLYKFQGQVGNERPKMRTTQQLTSTYGRIFFWSVFETIQLFWENPDLVKLAMDATKERLTDPAFHGVPGFQPELDTFMEHAKRISESSMLFAKCVGCKNAYEKNPVTIQDYRWSESEKKMKLLKFFDVSKNYFQRKLDKYFKDDTPTEQRLPRSNQNEMGVEPMYIHREEANPEVMDDVDLVWYEASANMPLERKLGECTITFDLGLTVRSQSKEVSLIPNGPQSIYAMTSILSGVRFDEEWLDTFEATRDPIIQELQKLRDDHQLEFIWDALIENLGLNTPERTNRLNALFQEPSMTMVDYEMLLMDFIQDEIVYGEEVDDNQKLKFEDLISQMSHSRYTSYPILCSNGMFSNTHSGKSVLLARIQRGGADGEEYTVSIDRRSSGDGEGKIIGLQIYDPLFRKLTQKKVEPYPSELVRLPHMVKTVLFGDILEDFKRSKELDDAVIRLVNWLENHLNEMSINLFYSKNSATRIEFFLEYQSPSATGRVEEENIMKFPDLNKCFSEVTSAHLRQVVRDSFKQCMEPLKVLRDQLKQSNRRTSMTNLSSIPKSLKVCIVAMTDLLLLRMNIHKFTPHFLPLICNQQDEDVSKRMDYRVNGFYQVPPQLRGPVVLGDGTPRNWSAATGLKFGIKLHLVPTQVFQRDMTLRGDFYSRKNITSPVIYLANQKKTSVRLSFWYATAVIDLREALLSLSARALVEDFPEDMGLLGTQFDTFSTIDIDAIAQITNGDLIQRFMHHLVFIMERLYQQNWFNLTTSWAAMKKTLRSGEAEFEMPPLELSVDTFPTNIGEVSKFLTECMQHPVEEGEQPVRLSWNHYRPQDPVTSVGKLATSAFSSYVPNTMSCTSDVPSLHFKTSSLRLSFMITRIPISTTVNG